MKKLFLFAPLLLCVLALNAHAQKVSALANVAAVSSNTLFSVASGGTATRSIAFGQLEAQLRTNNFSRSTNSTFAAYDNLALTGSNVALPLIIMDDDFGFDVGGTEALQVLFALEAKNLCRLLAVTTVCTNEFAAAVVNAFVKYHRPQPLAIGINTNSSYAGGYSVADFSFATNYPTDFFYNSNAPSAMAALRTSLALVPDGSVIFITSGQLDNLYRLNLTAADAISPLTGAQLIAAKVKRFVVMGGDYLGSPPIGNSYNFTTSPTAGAVWNSITNSTWFVGDTLGATANSGQNYAVWPAQSPAFGAATNYLALHGSPIRPAWDSFAVVAAVCGLTWNGTNLLGIAQTGTNYVSAASGTNTFFIGAGNHAFLTNILAAASWTNLLNGLMDDPSPRDAKIFRSGDTMTGPLKLNFNSTNAVVIAKAATVSSGIILNTYSNQLQIGEDRGLPSNVSGAYTQDGGTNMPFTKLELVGRTSALNTTTEPMLQFSRPANYGSTFASAARFGLGCFTATDGSKGQLVLQMKAASTTFLGNAAGWSDAVYWRNDLSQINAGPILSPLGTINAVSFGYSGTVSNGLYFPSAAEVGLVANGNEKLRVYSGGIALTATNAINFSPTSFANATDVRLGRAAGGGLDIRTIISGAYTNVLVWGVGSFGTAATNTFTATGITNTATVNRQAIFNATAVSWQVKNNAGTVVYIAPAVSTTNICITLQPGGAITAASDLQGTLLDW